MRLINVKTRQLEDFIGTNIPRYAILSHTWEQEEVSYDVYRKGEYKQMQGYHKIDMTCHMAKERGLSFAWVDTCCIDKSSSAELSEAINSMFQWYKRASVCYVYLSDLPPGSDWTQSLAECRWFTRGWTLQELIAPRLVVFFDSAWSTTEGEEQRTKSELACLLSDITKIDEVLLSGLRHLELGDQPYCVAQKMSWAAQRTTTRLEDKAYCLLGLFGVSMPLLYGEGGRAFSRLQEEIMRSTADLSILAWSWSAPLFPTRVPRDKYAQDVTSVIAESAADFIHCGAYASTAEIGLREFSISNTGIKLRARTFLELSERILLLPLQCTVASGQEVAIQLLHLGRQRYLRVDPMNLYAYTPGNLNADLPTDRYLLTRLPVASPEFRSWETLSSIMAYSRIRTLQILPLLSAPDVFNPWPANWYDRATQAFFINRDVTRDMCSIDIRLDLPYRCAQQIKLIALGWADTAMGCQFSIVNADPHGRAMDRIQEQVHQRHDGTRNTSRLLKYTGVPRRMSIHSSLHGTDKIAVISIHPRRHAPERFIHHHYYTVTISVDIFEAMDVPPVTELEWETEEMLDRLIASE